MDKITHIMKTFRNGLKTSGVNAESNVTQLMVGAEDFDTQLATDSMALLQTTAEDTIAIAMEGANDFSAVNISAAAKGAALALDVAAGAEKALTMPTLKGSVVNFDALGVEDYTDATDVSVEAFDGQSVNSAAYYTFAYNLIASKQDAFGETLFPTIVIDPTAAGANVETRVENLTEQILRSNSSSDKLKMKKTSIVKAMVNSGSALADDKNRLIPVSRPSSAAVLIPALEFTTKVTGEEITTAPIKIGATVPLMGISQTDAMLAKGVMDNTDSLDRRVVLDNVYYNLTDSSDVVSNLRFDVSAFPFNNFTYSTQDDSKDIALSFSTSGFVINTSNTKQVDGTASTALAELPADHDIVLKLVMHGNGNTADGDVAVYASAIELVEVRNAAGDIVPSTDASYADFAALIEKMNIIGYTLEAYTTNSNLRNMGQLVTVDTNNQIYVVPVRSGITIQKPLSNANGIDNDANYLKSQVTIAGIRTSLSAVKTLTDFADTMRNATANGIDMSRLELMGAARHLVNPYYLNRTIDLAATVDSIKSSERDDDISSAIVANIKKQVLAMKAASNYGPAYKVSTGGLGGNITVVIATSDTIAGYIPEDISIGGGFNVKVVSSANDLMTGRLFATFIIDDGKRNEKPNPLNFGQMFWRPEISAEVTKQLNGATIRALITNPSFLHAINLPVLTEFNITGLDAVLSKVTQNHKNV